RLPLALGRRHAVAPSGDHGPHSYSLAPRMKLSHEIVTLRTTHPFVIARGGSSEYRVVRVTVTADDGATGWAKRRRASITARRRTRSSPRCLCTRPCSRAPTAGRSRRSRTG